MMKSRRETEGKRELRRRITFEEVVHAIEQVRGEAWDTIITPAIK